MSFAFRSRIRFWQLLLWSSFFLSISVDGKRNRQSPPNVDNRLRFISEPVSVLAATDGRKITFKCVVSPPEAEIKWLLNGTILNGDVYEWAKISGNKLVIKLPQKAHSLPLPIHSENKSTDSKASDSESIDLQGAVFQCLAQLEQQVIVSQPAKLILSELYPYDVQENITISVIAGNTAVIQCPLPRSIPYAVTEFEYNNSTINYSFGKCFNRFAQTLAMFNLCVF